MARLITKYLSNLVVGIVCANLLLVSAAIAQVRVSSIVVEGNQRIPDSTIISLTGIEPGTVVSDGAINDALRAVSASNLFETVEVTPRSGGLLITVVERPTISRISIEGNRRLEDEELLAAISSAPRRVYSPVTAEGDAARIADVYNDRARVAANVTPKIVRQSDNRVDLIFEVSEGRVIENERVSFVGNRAFSDRRLRRVIETRQAGFLRSIIGGDTFIPERLAFDRQLLTDFYRSRGYVDFQVLDVSTELSRERNATFVTFNLREGQAFTVGEVSLTTDLENIDIEEYRRALRLRTGETWNPSRNEEQI